MWLRDFLPTSVPSARIMVYGYDTKLPGSQSNASILELSKKLLESVKTVRSLDQVSGEEIRAPTRKHCAHNTEEIPAPHLHWS